jgi:hypothetical protein
MAIPLQHSRAGNRCQEQPNLGATSTASGRASTSPAPTGSSHTRSSVWNAVSAEAAGWGCGCACPAAGWPAPTTLPTSTPRRTIKRPTILWPSRWSMALASAGVMSISAPSDSVSRVLPCTADSVGMCVQQLGRRTDRKEERGVTERQAHGSQPVGVRSGETPGSPVARPPASGESPGSRRGAVQLASPQHQAKPAASLGIPARAGQEGAEPAFQWRRPWTAPGSLERVPRNPPA